MAQLSVVPNSSKFHSLPNDEEAIFGIGAGWLWNAMCGFGMGNSSNLTLFQIDRPKYHAWLELRKDHAQTCNHSVHNVSLTERTAEMPISIA